MEQKGRRGRTTSDRRGNTGVIRPKNIDGTRSRISAEEQAGLSEGRGRVRSWAKGRGLKVSLSESKDLKASLSEGRDRASSHKKVRSRKNRRL